ncbi:MAG: DJ-1/PfpI family protein [Tissierellia bacterium]|nr:DJ-1/PfpI family protein [Tissierellia bacterium]
MKKLAIIGHDQFSLQEIANLMAMFKNHYDIESEIISSSKEDIKTEEGIYVKVDKTFDQFRIEDYYAIIVSGSADFRKSINDSLLIDFLHSLKDKKILKAAICAGPIFFAKAGLLHNKKFTNSLFLQVNEKIKYIDFDNFVEKPVVKDGDILTAVGVAYKEFAVEIARALGFKVNERSYFGFSDEKEIEYNYKLDDESYKLFREFFKDDILS